MSEPQSDAEHGEHEGEENDRRRSADPEPAEKAPPEFRPEIIKPHAHLQKENPHECSPYYTAMMREMQGKISEEELRIANSGCEARRDTRGPPLCALTLADDGSCRSDAFFACAAGAQEASGAGLL